MRPAELRDGSEAECLKVREKSAFIQTSEHELVSVGARRCIASTSSRPKRDVRFPAPALSRQSCCSKRANAAAIPRANPPGRPKPWSWGAPASHHRPRSRPAVRDAGNGARQHRAARRCDHDSGRRWSRNNFTTSPPAGPAMRMAWPLEQRRQCAAAQALRLGQFERHCGQCWPRHPIDIRSSEGRIAYHLRVGVERGSRLGDSAPAPRCFYSVDIRRRSGAPSQNGCFPDNGIKGGRSGHGQ